MAKLNMELKNKNEKILELLEHIEDLRVTVQVRDKAYGNLEEQFNTLMGDLRLAKQSELRAKALENQVRSLEQYNARLEEDLGQKIEGDIGKTHKAMEAKLDQESLVDQVQDLQKQLNSKKAAEQQHKSKMTQLEQSYKAKLDEAMRAQSQAQRDRDRIDSKLRSTSAQQRADLERLAQEKQKSQQEALWAKQKMEQKEAELRQ